MRTDEVAVDSRQRVSLAKVLPPGTRRIRVTAQDDGSFIVEPVVSIPVKK